MKPWRSKKKKEEVVNHIDNTTKSEHNVEENQEEVSQDNAKKARPKSKAKSKPKSQHDIDTKLTKADMKELADFTNQV